MPNRVLYVNPTADMYGASRSLLRLIGSINRDTYEPIVIVPGEGPLADVLRQHGVRVSVLPRLPVVRRGVMRSWLIFPFFISILPFVLYLWWFIRRHQVELVHTNSGVIFVAGISAWLSRTPHVWHLREMFADEFGRLWQYYRAVMLCFSDRIVCVSTPIANQFPQRSKVEVIYNGFELADFRVNPASVSEHRSTYLPRGLLAGEGKLVGVVGRISPRKGQDILLRAAAELKAEGYHQLYYLVVGDAFGGNEQVVADLQAFVAESGLVDKVVFTGFITDPRPLIASLDILVVPSILPEAFPGVVIEGMALGVPVIATATGGTVEQIQEGRSGLLIPPGDQSALVEAIKRVLDDPALADQMRRSGRERVESQFSLQTMLEKVHRLYAELLGQPAVVPIQGA